MSKNSLPIEEYEQRDNTKGGRVIPALCNIVGTLILIVVIAAASVLVVPKVMGYTVYNIVSGSMEPEIPIGSAIFVKGIDPSELVADDVIAFYDGGSVVAHRVVANQIVEGHLTTKGDANDVEDMNAVDYDEVIGRVDKHVDMLGSYLSIFATTIGKIYMICFAACGAMLNMLAGRLRKR